MANRSAGNSTPTSWWQVVGRVIRDRNYRALIVEALLLGIEDGILVPYLALFVTQGLNGTPQQAAFIYVPYGVVLVITGLWMSSNSDRSSRRRGLIIVSLVTSLLARAGLSFTSSYPVAVILYAVAGFGPFGLIFALLRDTIRSKEDDAESGAFITTLVRTVYSVGWLIGPVVGGFTMQLTGFRGLFIASSALILVAVIWASLEISDQKSGGQEESPPLGRLSGRDIVLLSLLFLAGILLLSGNTGRASFLSLYLTSDLHVPISWVSWTFSVAVFAELLLIPIAGRLADRFGAVGVFLIGIATQAAYFFVMSMVSNYWLMLGLQVVYAFVVATVSGVGIVFAQTLIGAERTALSTSSYLVAEGIAPLLNSALLGVRAISADLRGLFVIFGVFACGALLLVSIMSIVAHRGTAVNPETTEHRIRD